MTRLHVHASGSPRFPCFDADPLSAGGSNAGCSVDIRLRAFIPTPVVYLAAPFGIGGPQAAFNGNGRTFCYDCGTSKGDIQTTFSLTPSDFSAISDAG